MARTIWFSNWNFRFSHVNVSTPGIILNLYLPIMTISLQWTLSSVQNDVKRFNCTICSICMKCSIVVVYLLAEQVEGQAEWVLCPSINHQEGSQLLAGVEPGLSLELQLEQPLVEKLEQLPRSQHLSKMNAHNEMWINLNLYKPSSPPVHVQITSKPINSYSAFT